MTMIESVAVRQRGGFDFETHYDNLCALQSSCPLPAVKVHLAEGVLDLNGDRIRATDWNPILKTIRINKTLTLMAFRSYYQQTLEDQERAGYPIKKKTPAIRCKEITYRLCRALKECLQVTTSLKCLELQGIPLRERDLTALSKGIMKNNTLQHLSLEYSRIGDDGLEILCRGIKNSLSITSINLTGCSLTWKGADFVAKIIKHQATKRHNEAWQDSLRYRRPDLDRMPGIRRITVNSNPMLGDPGAAVLAEALKDDLWLKALDLQQCGLSEVGAKALLDVLKYNTTIVVLDVRQNPMIEQEMLHNIMEQVIINCNGQDTEYKWVKAEPLQDPLKPKLRKKRTKTLQNSFGKRTTIKSGQRRRSRSAGVAVSRSQNADIVKPGPGMPWRTAQRANRYRGYPPDGSPDKHEHYESVIDLSASPLSPQTGAHITVEYSTEDESANTLRAHKGSRHLESEDDLSSDRELKIELEHLQRRFREEKTSRAAAEEKIIELTLENKRLHAELEEYCARRSILDDDRVLESIESSFKQFHAFLDLVRDAGLGQLITLAGIDQSQMTIPLSSPQRQSLGGRLSSSFIKPHKLDLTSNNAVTSPESLFRPIRNTDTSLHQAGHSLATHLNDQTRNTTVNTTGMSSEADVSLPGPNVIYPHLKPDNYTGNVDPTLPTTPLISSMKPKSKFDELYQKVLRETEGSLVKNATSSEYSRPGIDYSKLNGSGGLAKVNDTNWNLDRDDTRHSDLGARSDQSHHSHSSRVSGRGGVSRDVGKSEMARQKDPDSTEEKLDLNPDDMIIEGHQSDSNVSDISNIEEDIQDKSPSKGDDSNDENF